MNSKKLITLLVLTTMLVAMVPYVPLARADLDAGVFEYENDDKAAWSAPPPKYPLLIPQGEKGHDIYVTAPEDSVASGYEVSMYWDRIQDWDGEKGHLNTTEADDDGGFEIWFKVPEADEGDHTLWFTATDQDTKRSETFVVIPDCDISTSSGLAGSKPYVDLWGFNDDEEVAILFIEEGVAGEPQADWNDINDYDDTIGIGDGAKTSFTGLQAKYSPMVVLAADPMTITLGVSGLVGTYDTTAGFLPNGAVNPIVPAGCSISPTTGVMTLQFTGAPAALETISVQYDAGSFSVAAENLGETVDVNEDDYDGMLDNEMIEPGTFVLTIGGEVLDDDFLGAETPAGNIYDDAGVDLGGINYVTGEWDIDLGKSAQTFTGGSSFFAAYDYFDDIENYAYVLTTAGMTNGVGSWEDRRINIPDPVVEAQYYVVGFDGKGNTAFDDYEIGATITLSDDEVDVGDVINIEGEGFVATQTVTVTLVRGTDTWLCHIIDADEGDNVVAGDGEFDIEIVVPKGDDEDDDYDLVVTDGTKTASADFELTGLADVVVDPDFGPQGSTITVSGKNFPNINDVELLIELYAEDAGEFAIPIVEISDDAETDSDGTFEIDVRVPTENDATYEVRVTSVADDDGPFNLWEQTTFRIGTILVLLSEDEGRVGEQIVLTGNGFTDDGEWNATFGDIVIFEDETCDDEGRLDMGGESPEFFVPQLQPGEYIITVWDMDAELSVEVEFTVTEYISIVLESYNAPNEYNVTIEAYNWPEVDGDLNSENEITFVLWNETDDWDMDVWQLFGVPPMAKRAARLNETGFMETDNEEIGDAYWIVPDDDTLDKGTYWINCTLETDNEQEFFVQIEFVVGDVHMDIAPRKSTFRIGDTVTFNIEHTFGDDPNQDILGGDIKVYDPDGTLYWSGDDLDTWSQVETWFEVPYSAQTAGGNPMVLLDDAPLGAWSYKWRDKDGDTLKEGTFNVEASTEDVLGEQIEDLNSAIDDLTSDISAVTDAVAGVQSNVNSAIAAANAAVEAANAAVTAVNAVAATAGDAAQAAQDAADAATDAKNAASGLTTLVYGAIGASLVAALAAIVSLMQISRRIAG
jgi:hypothetical protein